MDETQQLKHLLERAADLAAVPATGPDPERFAHIRRRRRGALAVAAAVGTVLAVVAALALVGGTRSTQTPAANPTRPAVIVPSPYPTSGPTTVHALAADHWSTLPTAPIAVRGQAISAWTGTAMIVWGGHNGSEVLGDGASYDPSTNTWTTLPPAPISARSGAESVWTGSKLFIWGGYGGANAPGRLTDGALYDPSTQTWTKLPPVPVRDSGNAVALWSGSAVILLSEPGTQGANGARVIHAQSYDPVRNTWMALPDLTPPTGHQDGELSAISAGGTVYVWSMWSHTVQVSPSETSGTSGVDGYTLDPTTGHWAADTLRPPQGSGVGIPMWTGREILVPVLSSWCGGCSGPRQFNLTGLRLDPATSASTPIVHGPVSDLGANYVWTGGALLGFNTGTFTSGGGTTHYPGEAAAWDPATNTWTSLPAAPVTGGEVAATWTGNSLLVWGAMFTTDHHGPAQQSPATTTSSTTGLRFGP